MDTKWSIRKFLRRRARGLRHLGAFAIADSGPPFRGLSRLAAAGYPVYQEPIDINLRPFLEGLTKGMAFIKERAGSLFERSKEVFGGGGGKERKG